MKSRFSRRDFLKLSGLTLGGLAFSPFVPGLTTFDDSFAVRIATAQMPVRKEPTDDSRIELSWYRDELVHVYEEVVAEEPKYNPVWYRVWGGYLHRGRVHRVKTVFHDPQDILENKKRLAELTVPYSAPYRYSKARGWEALTPPLYYGSVHWVTASEEGPPMAEYAGPWYKIFDELDSNVPYYVPAIHMKIYEDDIFKPITPEIPLEEKLIEVNLATQRVIAYEYGHSVFETNISSGIPGGGLSGEKGISTTTPNGKFKTLWKQPSKHMGNSYFSIGIQGNLLADVDNYVLPGVPWSTFFTPIGHAFHGTYWHENFGTPMSHGCINMRSEEARWIFCWAMPAHTADAISNDHGQGTNVEIHY
ncbi:MAG: L,D-transpeptidase family protein [Anaerolineales bacterium]|nr:L,D-transpeptidase family protein [Anaerolineales bacterium]